MWRDVISSLTVLILTDYDSSDIDYDSYDSE